MLYYIGETRNDVECTTLEHAIQYCSKLEICGLDIETSRKFKQGTYSEVIYSGGLDPYLSNICMIQIGDIENQFVIDARKVNLDLLIDFLNWNDDTLFIGHNLAFEGKFLRNKYNIRLRHVYDTMLAEISLYNGLSIQLSLEALAKKYLDVKSSKDYDLFNQLENVTLDIREQDDENVITPFEVINLNQVDKSIRLGFVNLGDDDFTYEQIAYGSDDIIYPILIRLEQLKGHTILGYKFCNPENILFESEYTQVGADMELNGLPFNVEHWKELEKENHIKYNERLERLNHYVITTFPKYGQYTLFGGSACVIDWSSPAQVIRFFKELGICPKEKSKQTKKMEWSVSAKALLPTIPYKKEYMLDTWKDITDHDTLMLAYLLLRKSQMNITTYGLDFLRYVHPITGRLHPRYRLHLISSRTATTSPNLLSVPASHRNAFTGNKMLVVNDYSSQFGSFTA